MHKVLSVFDPGLPYRREWTGEDTRTVGTAGIVGKRIIEGEMTKKTNIVVVADTVETMEPEQEPEVKVVVQVKTETELDYQEAKVQDATTTTIKEVKHPMSTLANQIIAIWTDRKFRKSKRVLK